jgi:peptide/nickel transport system permease protein
MYKRLNEVSLIQFIKFLMQFVFVSIAIVFISSFLSLFSNGINLSIDQFFINLKEIARFFKNPSQELQHPLTLENFNLFPSFWSFYFYSVTIFLAALVIAFFIGLVITAFALYLSPKTLKRLEYSSSLLEATPDIMIIVLIQFIVIQVYKQTNILLFPIAGAFDRAYLLPILTLSILPTIHFFKLSLLLVQDEEVKQYVEFVKSKGFTSSYIFIKHILRNVLVSLFNHSKSIIWFMLANLVMLEWLFNIYGITQFIFNYPTKEVLAWSLIFFYIPIFIILFLSKILLKKFTGQQVEL